jgi:hypothetical protein
MTNLTLTKPKTINIALFPDGTVYNVDGCAFMAVTEDQLNELLLVDEDATNLQLENYTYLVLKEIV